MKSLLFTYALSYGGAVVSLFDPFVGLLIYICFAILKPQEIWPWSIPPGNYSRVVALGLLAGWMMKGCGSFRFGRGRGVIVPLLGYLAWSAVSAWRAPDQVLAWGFVESMFKIVLPWVVGLTLIDSMRKLQQLAWVILLSQAYTALELNLTYYGGYNRLKEEGFAGMDNNSYAISLVACTGLAFFLGLHSEAWWKKATAFVSAALMMHATLFSFSRGGMVGLIVLVVVTFLLIPKRPKDYLCFLIAVLLGLSLAGAEVRARFLSSFASEGERDASAQSRLDLWAACWDTMCKHPVLGVGPDHMPLMIDRYGFPRGKESHTLWLQIGAELGFPGLLCLLLFYGRCLARLWPLARERLEVAADPWPTSLARMVIVSLSGFLISAQFVSLEALETPYYIGLIGAGVLKLASLPEPPGATELE